MAFATCRSSKVNGRSGSSASATSSAQLYAHTRSTRTTRRGTGSKRRALGRRRCSSLEALGSARKWGLREGGGGLGRGDKRHAQSEQDSGDSEPDRRP